LHQKLGKPIPDQSKLMQTSADGKSASSASKMTGFVGASRKVILKVNSYIDVSEYSQY